MISYWSMCIRNTFSPKNISYRLFWKNSPTPNLGKNIPRFYTIKNKYVGTVFPFTNAEGKGEHQKREGNSFRITRILRQIGQSDFRQTIPLDAVFANIVVRSVISLGRQQILFSFPLVPALHPPPPLVATRLSLFFSYNSFAGLFPYISIALLHVW